MGNKTVAILGAPLDCYSSYLRGAALAPEHIRRALGSPSSNLSTECGLDLGSHPGWQDDGDLSLPEGRDAFPLIEEAIEQRLAEGLQIITLGGDHSITYPIVRAYAHRYPKLSLLHIDAHPDLYAEFEGNRLSHACPFARIMEEGLVQRLVQAGIRTATPHLRQQAKHFNVETIEMRHWQDGQPLVFDGPVYLSLDLDALDPAFAPGVSHHEPGGFSTRQVLGIIQRVCGQLVGADIVELNPARDVQAVTAMTAAKLLKEILARMLE
jgi:agmatinase